MENPLKERRTIMMNPFRYRLFFGIFVLGMLLMLIQSAPTQAAEKMKAVDLSTAIIEVAKRNIPSVVHIEVTERQEVANPLLPFESDPFFRRFFDIPKMPNRKMPKNRR
jgi:serine protease Do